MEHLAAAVGGGGVGGNLGVLPLQVALAASPGEGEKKAQESVAASKASKHIIFSNALNLGSRSLSAQGSRTKTNSQARQLLKILLECKYTLFTEADNPCSGSPSEIDNQPADASSFL